MDEQLCPHCAGEQSRIYRPGAPHERLEVTSPEAAAEILVPLLQDLDREHCVTLNLDTKHRLLATTTVSIGSVDHTFMSPREVFRDALLRGASAIVIAHNHPSGDAEPSRDDERITRRIDRASEIVGVEVLDHVVVGHRRWVSLARRGVLMERDSVDQRRELQVGGVARRCGCPADGTTQGLIHSCTTSPGGGRPCHGESGRFTPRDRPTAYRQCGGPDGPANRTPTDHRRRGSGRALGSVSDVGIPGCPTRRTPDHPAQRTPARSDGPAKSPPRRHRARRPASRHRPDPARRER